MNISSGHHLPLSYPVDPTTSGVPNQNSDREQVTKRKAALRKHLAQEEVKTPTTFLSTRKGGWITATRFVLVQDFNAFSCWILASARTSTPYQYLLQHSERS